MKQFLFFGNALRERQLRGGLDSIDRREGGNRAALLLAGGLARRGKNRRVLLRRAELVGALARLAHWFAGHLFRERNRACQQLALDEPVDNSELQRVVRFDGISVRTHLDGLGHARQPRQTLRAGRAGNNPELYFRLADLRAGNRHAIVSGHRQLQTAAERGAVNGHDHRLAAILDAKQQRLESLAARWSLPEVILPNSLMSAPATKVRPPPMITAAFTASSFSICSMAPAMPSGTPGLSAFTGGLLMVITAMPSCRVS